MKILLLWALWLFLASNAYCQLIKCVKVVNNSGGDLHLCTIIGRLNEHDSPLSTHLPIILGPVELDSSSQWISLPNNITYLESVEWISKGKGQITMIGAMLETTGYYLIEISGNNCTIKKSDSTPRNPTVTKPYGFAHILNGFDSAKLQFNLSCKEEQEALGALRRASIESSWTCPVALSAPEEIEAFSLGWEAGVFGGLFEFMDINPDWGMLSPLAHHLESSDAGKKPDGKSSARMLSAFGEGYRFGYDRGEQVFKRQEEPKLRRVEEKAKGVK
jgi:hypothetical protein